ncbi:MAG: 2,3-bisphosphoglycerate-independent phosphoglycerate mutase [Zetaproteobacteria bacterium CG12_big_fil_rev_8_21_14_0_65_54_13]|nr:MAG: 2,3-bisphosphoglycerate-independent phosphoglycerate mutase [Zetaproteobacteria bacterium CG23_combo_of_CG06-09_8_20_14_all_54_7]PIW47560.1 MAG: 2,3-bisphosphoglycerate-independent phosphoglycerate mutase [Zetaproteobacteria bacterium CG12_big_fil_rev_8_21_14_0_65_54_13]PIX55201.1 MAG: 2,3-bisphosphoglycerate-independent phosphoglycerate mutase [Zetaproteobacteria bacterium CG_4_10_14_3_um_filter_54_28]PJA28083.1 MAG: 2,3-bisphosphoglycerate-independent phosphoglycerate mutase [Zetaprote
MSATPNTKQVILSPAEGPVLLLIMDGWGIGTGGPEDAIAQANTPVFDRLWSGYAHTELMTHGHFVGLPSGKDMGGSEVGHLTMGAGLILDQGPTRINKAIEDGSFYASDALEQVLSIEPGKALHLVGLLSDGNIHSHLTHFRALINAAFERGIHHLYVHALLDGRDVGIQTAQQYVGELEADFTRINDHQGFHYAFASGGGRERIIMDRDGDWAKVEAGWNLMVHGEGEYHFPSMMAAITHFRQQDADLVDQDMPGFVIVDGQDAPIGKISDGDAVVMVNFRGDRAIEITEAFELDDFSGFDRGVRPDIIYAGMMVYDEDRNLPALQLMGPTKVDEPFGKRILELGIKQFRLTETQKYPHVTFFFNGGYRQPLDASMEDYILIPSDKRVSFADEPQMKSAEIAARAVELIQSGEYGFGLINFANADMVGHCGKIKPAIIAVEAVDAAVGKIIDALQACGGRALITADHGNAEEMQVYDKSGRAEACTKHSTNPVPCILFDPSYDGSYRLHQPRSGDDKALMPGLSHLAATLYAMMGKEPPADLNSSLIEAI